MSDNLILCRKCGSNACYEFKQPELTTWICFGCGYTTNSKQNLGNKKFKPEDIEISLPELIKDLKFVDEEGYFWYPSVINQNEKGMVFPDGTSTKDWKWSAIKTVSVADDEKEKFVNPKGGYYLYKSDFGSLQRYDEFDFIEALDYIGYFK